MSRANDQIFLRSTRAPSPVFVCLSKGWVLFFLFLFALTVFAVVVLLIAVVVAVLLSVTAAVVTVVFGGFGIVELVTGSSCVGGG